MSNVIKDAINLLLPRACCVCGGSCDTDKRLNVSMPQDISICFKCLSSIVPIDKDRRWYLCLSEPYESDPIPGLRLYMPFTYDEFFHRAIPQIKFRYVKSLATFLGGRLGNVMAHDNIKCDVVVPVPLSPARMAERGFNQAEVIARECAKSLGAVIAPDALVRTRNTSRQTEISDNLQRSANVSGAFRANEAVSLAGKRVILVDDVATTGQTLHEAALALMSSGVKDVLCVALCGNRSVKNADPY